MHHFYTHPQPTARDVVSGWRGVGSAEWGVGSGGKGQQHRVTAGADAICTSALVQRPTRQFPPVNGFGVLLILVFLLVLLLLLLLYYLQSRC